MRESSRERAAAEIWGTRPRAKTREAPETAPRGTCSTTLTLVKFSTGSCACLPVCLPVPGLRRFCGVSRRPPRAPGHAAPCKPMPSCRAWEFSLFVFGFVFGLLCGTSLGGSNVPTAPVQLRSVNAHHGPLTLEPSASTAAALRVAAVAPMARATTLAD